MIKKYDLIEHHMSKLPYGCDNIQQEYLFVEAHTKCLFTNS